MPCGHTLEHSPQSVHLPATWNALIIWNIFSSKLSAAALLATPEFGLSNTQFSHEHAGQILRHALQRIHFESWLLQRSKRYSDDIASSFATSSKRLESITSPSSPISSSYATCFLLLHERHLSATASSAEIFSVP